jgi:hypothetical protein
LPYPAPDVRPRRIKECLAAADSLCTATPLRKLAEKRRVASQFLIGGNMRTKTVAVKPSTMLSALLVGAVLAFAGMTEARAELPADVQSKVDTYKKKLVEWAANPAVVSAVKESNTKGGLAAGMTNAKWEELGEADPVVKGFQTSAAGKLVSQWEEDKVINKLYVRDEKGNLVASSNKPLLFNVASRPPFTGAIKGSPWNAPEVKPDPTTQLKSVQISAPVLDGGKPIGVLHSAITVQ